ncbi:MAG: 16S rRNA (uracil(1498)-N(3))-methyltransferase [Pseudomonadota bacterium]
MNLILLEPEDFITPDRVRLTGRRLTHVLSVHQAQVGERLRVGLLDGLLGDACVTVINTQELLLSVCLHQPPPPKEPVILLLALPRPKMLRRILQMITTLGVGELVLLNSYRVEKSYWQTPWLSPEAIREQLLLGLEQARDTVLPTVTLAKRFKPFVEDQLPGLLAGRQGLLAHPVGGVPCPASLSGPLVLAIGPEGGFIPYEVEQLQRAGLMAVDLGQRILRVETAVAVALGRLAVIK